MFTAGAADGAGRTIATVMLLQAHEGLSDREACDRLAFDLRWKAASGLAVSDSLFHPTVLVGMRNGCGPRIGRGDCSMMSTPPPGGRVAAGSAAGAGSTALYDAVATRTR